MELKRAIDYKEMTLEEVYENYENKKQEYECDGDKHKLITIVNYSYKPVKLIKKEDKK